MRELPAQGATGDVRPLRPTDTGAPVLGCGGNARSRATVPLGLGSDQGGTVSGVKEASPAQLVDRCLPLHLTAITWTEASCVIFSTGILSDQASGILMFSDYLLAGDPPSAIRNNYQSLTRRGVNPASLTQSPIRY